MMVRSPHVSGAASLASGAVEAGVSLVVGYPGGPATAIFDAILANTSPEEVRLEWTSNEKVAIEIAFGASLNGTRSLLCAKSVGLNIALDPLMTGNLCGCHAGFVILVGDDPGSWASQNEQDSRTFAWAAELPMLEPTSIADARLAMRQAFRLSEEVGLPVLVRVTRALVLDERVTPEPLPFHTLEGPRSLSFEREYMRCVVLPVNAVPYHRRLQLRLEEVVAGFEHSALNGESGEGSHGVIAAGFDYQKLVDLLGTAIPPGLRLLRLGTFHPLPHKCVTAFLQRVDSALVLEETGPLVEQSVRAVAQEAGLVLPICGRSTGHVPAVGEIFAPHIASALNRFAPGLALPVDGVTSRPMPSRRPLCEGCPYTPVFAALLGVMDQMGGRDQFIIVGDPGCMVRAQSEPYQLLDVKLSLGSSIGIATGIALGQVASGKRVVALCGDSGFLHSGLNGLVDAARLNARLLVIILDNGTTAMSGGQPHAASDVDARGRAQKAVDLAALAQAAGVPNVRTLEVDQTADLRAAIEAGMYSGDMGVIVARGQCPKWPMDG